MYDMVYLLKNKFLYEPQHTITMCNYSIQMLADDKCSR